MIKTFTPFLRSTVLPLFFFMISFSMISQNTNKAVKKQEKQIKKQASKADVDAYIKALLLQKYPEEAKPQNDQKPERDRIEKDKKQSSGTVGKDIINGIQSGRQYNLKKVLNNSAEENLFTKRQDNPELRAEYNNKRLRDPSTGLIPENIQERELEYVQSSKSKLQLNPVIFKNGTGVNIPNAPGDQTSPWVNRGPFNVGGRTRALAIDINNENRILAGGVSGGLWESTDQGQSWSRITPPLEHPTITDIVQDPRPGFGNIWYYTTGERIGASQSGRNGSAFLQGNGVYISTNNAATFTPLASTVNPTPQSFDGVNEPFDLTFGIDIDPNNGNVYVATFNGIYRSTDLGTTFTQVLPSDFDNFTDIHITASGVLYATLDSGAGAAGIASGIFRSTDGAAGTWVNITDPSFPVSFGRTVIYTAPSNENVLYLFAANTSSAPIDHDFWKYTYISGDGTGAGGTWENRTANLPNFGGPVGDATTQGGYDMFVRVHPTDENIVFLGTINIFRSLDGFATPIALNGWIGGYSPLNDISLYTNQHPDQHSFEFFPSNPNRVISGHDGGLSLTENILADSGGTEPVTWSSLNNGYLTTQVYALSIGPGDQILAGFQDNSTWFTNTTATQTAWTDLFSGDGSYNAFNDDGTIRYLSAQNGNVFRATYPDANSTTLTSLQSIRPLGSTGFLFVNPFELDPNEDEIMYFAAGNTVWRNDDLTNATTTVGWAQLTNAAVAAGTVSAIGISTNPANRVYIGSTTGQLVRIDNANTGNPAGVNVSAGLPNGNIASIAVDPNNADRVFVVLSNYSIPSVFFSVDAGANWTDISGNLEENPDGTGAGPSVRWINIVGNNDLLLVGTSTGMFSTTTLNGASTSWSQVDPTGIGNAIVEQIRSRPDGLVAVGTHGNGVYSATFETSVPAVIINEPIANFEVAANSADTVIDVNNVFASNVTPALPITVSVESVSDPAILNASVNNNSLTLSYLPNAFGPVTVTLRGEDSNGDFTLSSFIVTVNVPPINTFPYTEDFETGVFPEGWETSGPFNWFIDNNGTPSGNTGPLGDNTQADGSGFYAYTEASGPSTGDQGILFSREVDLNSLTNPILEFFYHMFGVGTGSLEVQVVDVTNGTTTSVFNVSGPQQANQADPYIGAFNIDLSAFTNSVIQLQFIGTRGGSFTSDIAIDDISILEQPADDIGVTAIQVSSDPFFSNSEDVTITLSNFGTAPQSGFDVSYTADGGTTVTEVFNGTLQPNSTSDFTFSTAVDLSAAGAHTIIGTTELGTDSNTLNDAFTQNFNTVPVIGTFPYTEDFEGLGGNLPTGWIAEGPVVWLLDSAGTPSAATGPSADNTIGDATGTYIYAEASGPQEGDMGSFTTFGFDLNNITNPGLEFFYHMFGNDIETLTVDVIDITNGTETTVFALSGQQQMASSDPYIKTRINLAAFTNSVVQLRFTSTRGANFAGDIAIDDISLFQLPGEDLVLLGITNPPISQANSSNTVTIEIGNIGAVAQSGFDVSYQFPGEAAVVETFTGTIAPGETASFTFATPFTSPSTLGPFTFEASTLLAGDDNTADDILQFEGLVLEGINTFPFTDSFEATSIWIPLANNNNPNLSFELGTPAGTTINSASDGTQAWVTNLTGNYNNNEQSFLFGPVFNFTNIQEPVILMDIWYETEVGFDGAILQSSTDNGVSWQLVGNLGDVPNWYNGSNAGSLNFAETASDSWTGSSGGYLLAINNLEGLGGESAVTLRIVFASEASITDEGFAIDNVRIADDQDLFQIVCPDDISVSADTGVCEALVTIPAPTFTNLTGGVTVTNSFNGTDNASGTYPLGTTLVTWTAVNDQGIVRTCDQLITINDTENPIFADCPADITVGSEPNLDTAVVNFDTPIATDSCDNVPLALVGFTFIGNLNGNDFYISDTSFTPDVAFTNAVAEGGFVATIDDAAENQFIVDFLTAEGIGVVLIGYNDLATEGTFEWQSGSTSTFTSWDTGQPDDAGDGEDYTELTAAGIWNDINISVQRRFVLEVPERGGTTVEQTAGLPSGSAFPVGTNTIEFTATDASGNTSICSFDIIVEDNDFMIPDNILVETVSESCPGLENGIVNITVNETNFDYTATLDGNGLNLSESFTETVSFADLPVGVYSLCVSVDGRNFEQCFEVNIEAAPELDIDFEGVLPDPSGEGGIGGNAFSFEIREGTGPFNIRFNGRLIQTTNERSFKVQVSGSGLLEVESARLCEGIFSVSVEGGFDEIRATPNPVIEELTVQMPLLDANELPVRIFSISGQEVYSQLLPVSNSSMRVPFGNLTSGVYFVRIEMDKPIVLKIVKQ